MKHAMVKPALMTLAFLLAICASSWITAEVVRSSEGRQQAQSAQPASGYAEQNVVEEFRTERQQLRQMQKSQLNEIIHGAQSDDEIVLLAQRQLLEMLEAEEQELTLEGILKMRGFEDAVVTVHTDSVNVILRCETITQQETAVILELVMRETGVTSGNVKIIPIN